MIKLKDPIAQGLIDKIIKELKDVNYKRKASKFEIEELSIPRIVAPLWYYLGDKNRSIFFKDLLADLKAHPDYCVTLVNQFDASSRKKVYHIDFAIIGQFVGMFVPYHYYEIEMFDSTIHTFPFPIADNVPQFWNFNVYKNATLTQGCWDMDFPETTTGYDYSEFVENLEAELC